MTWTFEQSTGAILDADGKVLAIGYAGGNCGKNPEGKNNPDMQYVPCVGPLPEGLYTAGTPVEGSHLGPYAVPLIPDPSNVMHGRGSFYMHGDSIESPGCASEGCIIAPRVTREAFVAGDAQIHVVRGGV